MMTTLTTTERQTTQTRGIGLAALIGLLAVVIAMSLPNVADGDVGSMTHYMGLLAASQPWNLILFMAP